jgi:hypothetical protein
MKHGIGFTANLIELLEELRKGNFSMIWYNFGMGGRVEILFLYKTLCLFINWNLCRHD